MTRTPQAGHW